MAQLADPRTQTLAAALAGLHEQAKTLRTPTALGADLLAQALLQRRYGSSANPSPSMGEGQGWGWNHAVSGGARERSPLSLQPGSVQGASPADDLSGRGLTPIPNPSPIEGEGLPQAALAPSPSPSLSPGAPAPSAPGGTASAAPAASSPAAGAAGAYGMAPTLADALRAYLLGAPAPAPAARAPETR